MAVQVRVPTILRSYTGGSKVVEGAGETLGTLFVDLDGKFPGLRGRLVSGDGDSQLHRFVNVYINDEDVRFIGGLDAKITDGDSVTILPAVAGGSAIVPATLGGVTILPAVAGGSANMPATLADVTCCPAPTATADARLG